MIRPLPMPKYKIHHIVMHGKMLLILLLIVLYGLLVYLSLNPNVTYAYKAYYITRQTTDWRPPRYVASLDEGVNFIRFGLPEFVDYTVGISSSEKFGRWTDANLNPYAIIRLKQGVSGSICLVLCSFPGATQIGRPVYVRLGVHQASFVPLDSSAQCQHLPFHVKNPSNSIEIEPSSPAKPERSTDTRKLGIALISLSIKNYSFCVTN
jgi:hypothetical protein